MIVYGTGGGQAVLGQLGQNKCPACEQETTFSARVVYRYFHIWYLFSFLTKRDYYVVCDHCESCATMDKAELKTKFPRDNIPFIRKRGWLVCVGIFAAIVAVSMLGNQLKTAEMASLLDAPKVEDIYLANMAEIGGSGYEAGDNSSVGHGDKAYGAMKLLLIDGDDLTFVISKRAYGELKDMRKELSKGSFIAYETTSPVVLTRNEVRRLLDRGIIVDVKRKK